MKLTLRGKIFFGTLSIVVLSLIVLFSGITSFALKKDSNDNYFYYTVKQNDTIWSIACEHTKEGKDIRQTQYEIKKLNNINPSEIRPGMRIAILK